jgi:hypothetical protein
LNERNDIDDNFFRVLDWFRKLRNRAAHEPLFEITEKDLLFVKQCGAKSFSEFCVDLVTGFWNSELDTLGPVFAPNIVGNR